MSLCILLSLLAFSSSFSRWSFTICGGLGVLEQSLEAGGNQILSSNQEEIQTLWISQKGRVVDRSLSHTTKKVAQRVAVLKKVTPPHKGRRKGCISWEGSHLSQNAIKPSIFHKFFSFLSLRNDDWEILLNSNFASWHFITFDIWTFVTLLVFLKQ